MNETIKKFKNDIESIEIPEKDLQKAIGIAIRKGGSKKSPYKKVHYISSVAVLLFALVLGSGFVSPTMANVLSQVPYLNSVLPFTDKGLKLVNEQGLIQSVGQTVIDQTVPITITDVYYDNSRLEIGYVIPLENIDLGDLRDIKILGISKMKVYLDGREIDYTASADYKEEYIIGTISDTHSDLSQFSQTSKLKIEVTEVLNRQEPGCLKLIVQK